MTTTVADAERVQNWDVRLLSVIDAWRSRAYACGPDDCCAFAGDVIQAVTGLQPYADFVGYTTQAGAVQKLRERGYGSLRAALRDLCGAPVPRGLARRGDLGWLPVGGKLGSLGVVVGGAVLFLSERGWTSEPLRHVKRYYTVGARRG